MVDIIIHKVLVLEFPDKLFREKFNTKISEDFFHKNFLYFPPLGYV